MEWPIGNALWNLDVVKMFLERFRLMPVDINGCMLGHTGVGGGLMCKPWTLMTSSPYIYDVFKDCKCPGEAHSGIHETVHGSNTWRSAMYPTEMCDRVHHAIGMRLDPKYRRDWISKYHKKMKNEKSFAAMPAEVLEVADDVASADASAQPTNGSPAVSPALPGPVVYAGATDLGRAPIGYYYCLDNGWVPVYGSGAAWIDSDKASPPPLPVLSTLGKFMWMTLMRPP